MIDAEIRKINAKTAFFQKNIDDCSKEYTVSIIICTLNASNHLQNFFKSLQSIKFPHTEVVIIDGASGDNTMQIIQSASNIVDKYISEPDKNVYDAMNKGIAISRGKWVYFIGSDDRIRSENYLQAIKTLKQNDTIYYGDVWMQFQKLRWNGQFSKRKLVNCNISHQAIFYPRSIFTRHQFNPRYPVLADWELNIRCWADPLVYTTYLPVIIADCNDRDGISSHFIDPHFEHDFPRIVRQSFPSWIAWPGIIRRMLRRLKMRLNRGSYHGSRGVG